MMPHYSRDHVYPLKGHVATAPNRAQARLDEGVSRAHVAPVFWGVGWNAWPLGYTIPGRTCTSGLTEGYEDGVEAFTYTCLPESRKTKELSRYC